MFTLQISFKPLLLKDGGKGRVKSVRRGDCEQQGGKLLRLLSQLRPRIGRKFLIAAKRFLASGCFLAICIVSLCVTFTISFKRGNYQLIECFYISNKALLPIGAELQSIHHPLYIKSRTKGQLLGVNKTSPMSTNNVLCILFSSMNNFSAAEVGKNQK